MVHFSLIILTKRYFGKFSIIIRSNKAKMAQEALSSGLRIISEAHFLDNNYHHFFWFFFANNKNNWFPNPRHFLREKTSHKSYHQLIADFWAKPSQADETLFSKVWLQKNIYDPFLLWHYARCSASKYLALE